MPGKRRSWGRRIRSALVFLVLSVLVVVVGFIVFLRVALDGPTIARLAVDRIETATGKAITFSTSTATWKSLEKVEITVEGVQCRNDRNSPVILTVPKLTCAVRLMPLLRLSLFASDVRIFNPIFVLTSGNGSDSGTERISSSPRFPVSGLVLKPYVQRLAIVGGSVTVGETHRQGSSRSVLFSNISVEARHLTLQGVKWFKAHAEALNGRAMGTCDLQGSVTSTPFSGADWAGDVRVRLLNCAVAPLRSVLLHYGYDPLVSDGRVDLSVDLQGGYERGGMALQGELKRGVIGVGKYFTKPVSIERARIRLSSRLTKNTLRLDISELRLPGLSLSLEATTGLISESDPHLTIVVRGADLDLGKVFPLIPSKLISVADRRRLQAAGLRGRIHVRGGAWRGRLSRLIGTLDWRGTLALDASLSSVSGFIPGFGLPIENATGSVKLGSNEINFNKVRLTLGNSPIIVNGTISNLQSSPRGNLFISLAAHGEDLAPILKQRPVVNRLPSWLAGLSETAGEVRIKLRMKGELKHPVLRGRIALSDFGCRVSDLPLPVSGLTGFVDFEESGLSVSDMKGSIGKSEVQVHGSMSSRKLDIRLNANVAPKEVQRMGYLPAEWRLGAKVPVVAHLKGKPKRIEFSAKADLKKSKVRIGQWIEKNPGIPLAIEASGTMSEGDLSIEQAYLVLKKARISAKGTIDKNSNMTLSVHLPPKGIPTDALSRVANSSLAIKRGGRIDGDADIEGDLKKPSDLKIRTNLVFSHVSFHLPGLHRPFEAVTGRFSLRGKTAGLKLRAARLGETRFSGQASVVGLAKPKFKVHIVSSSLHTPDWTESSEQDNAKTWGEWIRTNALMRFLARGDGTIILDVKKGNTGWRSFSHFRATFHGKQGLIDVPEWKARYAGGTVIGNALFDIRANTKEPIKLDFQADHLRMSTILLSNPDKVSIKGDTLISGQLVWHLTDRRENAGIYKTGTMEVRVRKGVIQRFEVLSKIFSLLNLGLGSILSGRLPDFTSQGMPYQLIRWHMDVFDTRWKVTDLEVISDVAQMIAAGMYFSDQQRVDFIVKLSPLVGLDTLFKGLFGNLFTRDGKLLTATFRVRGLYSSPDVRLVPPESIKIRR